MELSRSNTLLPTLELLEIMVQTTLLSAARLSKPSLWPLQLKLKMSQQASWELVSIQTSRLPPPVVQFIQTLSMFWSLKISSARGLTVFTWMISVCTSTENIAFFNPDVSANISSQWTLPARFSLEATIPTSTPEISQSYRSNPTPNPAISPR
jgi:hypothetical protein